jgi:hypothetical protein
MEKLSQSRELLNSCSGLYFTVKLSPFVGLPCEDLPKEKDV